MGKKEKENKPKSHHSDCGGTKLNFLSKMFKIDFDHHYFCWKNTQKYENGPFIIRQFGWMNEKLG